MKNSFFTHAHPIFAAAFRFPAATILFILSLFPLSSGAQHLDWVQQAGGTGFQETRSMAIAPDGNVFVIGSCDGTSVFGSDAARKARSSPWMPNKTSMSPDFLKAAPILTPAPAPTT